MAELKTLQPALPAKCDVCERPMESPVVCAGCHTLHAPSPQQDYFGLMGLAPRYDVDPAELRRKLLTLSREIHPDRLAGKPDEVVNLSLEIAARVNRAYEVLADPVLRAEYLLELSGGKSAAEDKTVPPEVLTSTLMLREEIEEARTSGDTAALAGHKRQVVADREHWLEAIGQLARSLPGDESLRRELRLRLNASKYFTRLLEQLN